MPLKAPPCAAVDPATGLLLDGPNPCSTTVQETYRKPNYIDPQLCTLPSDKTMLTVVSERAAPAITLRTPGVTMTMVDPVYPGDSTCIGDRGGPLTGGPLTNVPLVFPNFRMTFNQIGGYQPLALAIAPSYPVKVVRGPGDSIWVIDDGDFLSTTVGLPSTRGAVYRVDPWALDFTIRLR